MYHTYCNVSVEICSPKTDMFDVRIPVVDIRQGIVVHYPPQGDQNEKRRSIESCSIARVLTGLVRLRISHWVNASWYQSQDQDDKDIAVKLSGESLVSMTLSSVNPRANIPLFTENIREHNCLCLTSQDISRGIFKGRIQRLVIRNVWKRKRRLWACRIGDNNQ